ncbi:unnamed protein product [Lupinus luteus]|uniref:DAGKc domain-containing protein n=1 Tax=Lupinus luteus TaxID=3873 RepID=A0AAV1X087_LUPLU
MAADHSQSFGSSSYSRKRDLVFIVNPLSANGRTGKEWKKLVPYLRSRLSKEYNIRESLTSGPCHAIDITREAIREGAEAVIAVGGDGTLHEVVNGFFWAGKPVASQIKEPTNSTALGVIPLGTGSDFARTVGWKSDPCEAIERVARGLRTRIDVRVISGEIGVQRQVFMLLDTRDLVNEGEWETCPQVMALCIGNAKYFGSGMKITPNVDPRSGKLEDVILQNFKWYDFLLKMHKLYNGTHLTEKNVSSRRRLMNTDYIVLSNLY